MTPPALALFGPINIPANAYNCYRVYGSVLLLLMFICVFIGVKFVSKFSPIALFCVIFSILCVYIGIFIANPDRGPRYVAMYIVGIVVISIFGCPYYFSWPGFHLSVLASACACYLNCRSLVSTCDPHRVTSPAGRREFVHSSLRVQSAQSYYS